MQAQPTTTSAASRSAPCDAVPKPQRKGSTSALYWLARNVATLQVYLTAETLMDELDVSHPTAVMLITELQVDDILGEPDMFGTYALGGNPQREVSHV